MSVVPPGADRHDLHSLTLVLSTQRSGSTLLGRDIESLGGLGTPREHFQTLANEHPDVLTEAVVWERLGRGVDESAPGVAGVKVQVNQVRYLAEALTGRRPTDAVAATTTIIDWFQERFDRVLLIILVRNAVDTAISRVFVKETGTYLSSKPRPGAGSGPAASPAERNVNILEELATVSRHRSTLRTVAAHYSDLALLLTYDELTANVEQATRHLLDHAARFGFTPRSETVTRTLTKLIDVEEAAAVRESFLDYLRTETGP